ncbi:MAG: S24/S26 family peptidase [Clostridiaceae bacterium]
MQKLKRVKSENIFPVIKELLDKDKSVRITVTGMSMHPFLRENIDSVELLKAKPSDIRKGDIVMILRDSNVYVMHRVIKIEENWFYMVGDAQQSIEGPLRYDQIFAKVISVWRKDKKIDCSNLWWKFLSNLWMILLPFRSCIIKSFVQFKHRYLLH